MEKIKIVGSLAGLAAILILAVLVSKEINLPPPPNEVYEREEYNDFYIPDVARRAIMTPTPQVNFSSSVDSYWARHGDVSNRAESMVNDVNQGYFRPPIDDPYCTPTFANIIENRHQLPTSNTLSRWEFCLGDYGY